MIDKSLLEHIHIEYDQYPYLITEEYLVEEHGYVPQLDKYVECFKKALPTKWDNRNVIVLTDENFSDMKETFFRNIQIRIRVNRLPEGNDDFYSGEYIIDNPYERIFNNKIFNSLIKLQYDTSDSSTIRHMLTSMFSHELTHMYENYQRKLKFRETLSDTFDKNYDRYRRFFDESSRAVKYLKQFLYWTDDQEVNANIGSLKSELMFKADQISNSKKAEEILENTKFYYEYNVIKNWVTKRYITKEIRIGEKAERNLLAFMDEAFPEKKITNLNQLGKFCLNRWYKCDRKIKNRLGKIFVDLYVKSEDDKKSRIDYPIRDLDENWI